MSNASEAVVDGLTEQIAQLEAEKSKTAKQRERAAEKAEKALAAKVKWAEKLFAGSLETAKGTRENAQVHPETVRASTDGELVNGKPAKGWVVEIECEVCGDTRLVNLQDAFQVTRCTKSECRKKGNAKGKMVARVAEISELPVKEQQALLETLQAEIAQAA
ncbi:hypothetical protein KAR91_54875 [Candidatus Pacearchaeota archaeon]|nr:hypothetical protein [Candidatus Pacearchaeota archaeon]